MVKRKGSILNPNSTRQKKGKHSTSDVKPSFREGLFDKAVQDEYRRQYFSSTPYKHAVINTLISDNLLRSVFVEIFENLHFTPKETDIYRIHQSGDLANLSGLDKSSLSLLPSLLTLRNALYSETFRDYICAITGCGALSGSKTDMAINVYTPGCHLLTHDDVIGSRRVSYILYLTDPGNPWRKEWGGSLRLYPTKLAEDGETRVPEPQWSKVIPPAWNQLSFFEVQPGLSFHDVEEVYEGGPDRIRMAISGWFHIPQEGEEGYIPGLERELEKKSSLHQLQSKSDSFDLPQPQTVFYDQEALAEAEAAEAHENGKGKEKATQTSHEDEDGKDDQILSEKELDFLLRYISPTYLTPTTLGALSEAFADDSAAQITNFLCTSFSNKLKSYIATQESSSNPKKPSDWKVAVPPHKHRFLYLQKPKSPDTNTTGTINPIEELLTVLFPSKAFKKLLQLATGLCVDSRNILARRFRRGLDYTLATGYGRGDNEDEDDDDGEGEGEGEEDAKIRLEVCLGITPTEGWGATSDSDGDSDEEEPRGKRKTTAATTTTVETPSKQQTPFNDHDRSIGGYEIYMSADPSPSSSSTNKKMKDKPDPAIYTAPTGDDGEEQDSGILFSMPASWNRLSIVARDGGVLKFVKYVSRSAKGDRWDVVGEWGVVADDDDEGEEEGADGGNGNEEEEEEEEWMGFPDSD